MRLTIIEKLRQAKPKKRAEIITAMNAKNVAFFRARNPTLGEALPKLGTGNFEIRINDEFLDVIERGSQQYCHPPGKLLEYVERVASWHHSGWIDKMELIPRWTGQHEHQATLHKLLEALYASVPGIPTRMQSGIIKLPRARNGRRFSGSTVFLGVLTGLHIAQYLNTTDVRDVVIIEPDPPKFALSTWFLDYEAIEKEYGRLVLHVGEELPENPMDYLMAASPVTAGAWIRMLPIYPSDLFSLVIDRVNVRWRGIHEIIVPFDREVRNLRYGAMNVKAGVPILSRRISLSDESRIAVVASGPSLNKDMEWLRANRDRLIIFAALSCIRALKNNGIKPDFQCTLDTELDDALFHQLELHSDVPLVAYYKLDPDVMKKFDTVLLVPEANKANAVRFQEEITFTHPTTGNMCAATALFMKPKVVYLLGLDLGFRKATRSHVAGGWHDDNQGVGHELETADREQIPAQANFPDSAGDLFTHAYYYNSRAAVAAAIATAGATTQVFNLSDGVHIDGAQHLRSDNAMLREYPDRVEDLKKILTAFDGSQKGVWTAYERKGADITAGFRKVFGETFPVTSETMDWRQFAKALDAAWHNFVVESTTVSPGDIRIEAYSRLILDLLAEWYRAMIFTSSAAEFRRAYETGRTTVDKLLGALEWPPELDLESEVLPESSPNGGQP